MRDAPGSDAALWLPGPKTDDGQQLGIAQKTIAALREVGVLDELGDVQIDGRSGVMRYPGADVTEPTYRTVGIRGVWQNWLAAEAQARGEGEISDTISKQDRTRAHDQVEQIAREIAELPAGYVLDVSDEEGQLVAYTERGNRFGVIRQGEAREIEVGQRLTVRGALASDGNLRVAVKVL